MRVYVCILHIGAQLDLLLNIPVTLPSQPRSGDLVTKVSIGRAPPRELDEADHELFCAYVCMCVYIKSVCQVLCRRLEQYIC
jgi:hypothetical protein